MGEIERILIELEADTAVRAVVLTGAGRAFSSGGDQKRSGESPSSFFEGDLGGALIERLNRCVLRMQRLQKPIIGSINGVAAGAGMNIALATDLRLLCRHTAAVNRQVPRLISVEDAAPARQWPPRPESPGAGGPRAKRAIPRCARSPQVTN